MYGSNLTPCSRVVIEKLAVAQLAKNILPFAEPEPKRSLLQSNQSATGLYPVPDKCSLQPYTHLFKIKLNIIPVFKPKNLIRLFLSDFRLNP